MGVPESLAEVGFVMWGAPWLSSVLSIGLWVARDADARGSSQPRTWGILSVLPPAGLIVLPYYFYIRSRGRGIGPRQVPPTAVDRALATWAVAGTAGFVGSGLLASPDPITMSLYAAGALAVSLPVAYLLVYRGGYRTIAVRMRT